MADEEQLKILKQGALVWNAWREENPGLVVDLKEADVEGADLNGADLSCANLWAADFHGAHLIGVNFRSADLRKANLINTHLGIADFAYANLSGCLLLDANFVDATCRFANFDRANLCGANLTDTNLTGANLNSVYLISSKFTRANLANATFKHAILGDTLFSNIDLSIALDLDAVIHNRPSSIGIDTLYRSKGKISEPFMRNCGVPDSFITQAKALIGAEEGMQFYSCFISYSGVDEEFARRLHGRLQQEHVRVWFAPEDLHSGQKLHEQIDEAIRVFDKLLIVLSPNSLKSEWVLTELRKARKRERQHGKRKLFPMRLVDYDTLRDWECFDADYGQDLATEVREYFIPDFSNWKDHDAFEVAFARLLKDLRETDSKAAGMK